MAVGIPASRLDNADLKAMRIAARRAAQQAVIDVVKQKTVVRDIMPADISQAAAAAALYGQLSNKTALVANTWDVNDLGAYTRLPAYQAIAIFGYEALAASPQIQGLAFTLGPATVAQFQVAACYVDEIEPILYFDPPLLFRPQQLIGINFLAAVAVAANAEPYALLGYVAEAEGNAVISQESDLV